MTVFQNPAPLPYIPDDLTVAQFILREYLPSRPLRPRNVPYFIEDSTGREVNYEEVRINTWLLYGFLNSMKVHRRTVGLANALSIKWNIGMLYIAALHSTRSDIF